MTGADAVMRDLLDREIVLACLAEAADRSGDSDLGDGKPARRLLDIDRRASRTLRLSLERCAQTSALTTPRPRVPAGTRAAPSRPLADALNGLAMARLVLDLGRGELAATRFDAADLRDDARALRAQARQIRRKRATG